MAAAGIAIGLPVALATTKFVKSFLFDMKANDPWTFAGAAAVLGLAAVGSGLRSGVAGVTDRSVDRSAGRVATQS